MKKLISFMKSVLLSPFYLIQGIASNINSKLKQALHSSVLSTRGLIAPLLTGLMVFVIAYFMQPFGIAEYSNSDKLLQIGILGGLAFIGIAICQFVLPMMLKSFYDEHQWTVSRQIVQSILMLVISSLLVFYYLNYSGLGKIEFPLDFAKFVAVLFIPIVLFTFIQESVLSNSFASKSNKIMESVQNASVIAGENPLKMLVFNGNSNQFSLIPNQLIYAKVGDNESEFIFQNFFGVEKNILQIQKEEVIKELTSHPQFTKINEDYYINVNGIKKVSGNARGYELEIAKTEKELKVSRKFKKNIENL
jgi:hypothetical protein